MHREVNARKRTHMNAPHRVYVYAYILTPAVRTEYRIFAVAKHIFGGRYTRTDREGQRQ